MRILVTSVGSNPAIGVIKMLKNSEHFVFGVDSNYRHLCAGAGLVDGYFRLPLATDFESYKSKITRLIEEQSIQVVIPIHDLEAQVAAALKSESDTCFWLVNEPEVIDICNDKLKANLLCENLGIPVPDFGLVNSIKIEKPKYIVKPRNGVSSRGVYTISSEKELKKVSKEFMIQEFIDFDVEYTVDCYSTKEGVFYGGVCRERIETKDGMSTKSKTVLNDKLISYSSLILDYLKFVGPSNLQFFKKNDEYYFVEINPRFAGAGILTFRSGFNIPKLAMKDIGNEKMPKWSDLTIKYDYYMTRYWEEVFYEQ